MSKPSIENACAGAANQNQNQNQNCLLANMNMIRVIKFKSFSNCFCVSFEDQQEKELILYSKYPLVDYSLVCNIEDSTWLAYCCTADGNLYKVNLLDARQKICSKANTSGDQDVFSDLLDEAELVDGFELKASTKPVYKLQSCDLIFKFGHSVSGLCVACDFVAVTHKIVKELQVHVYREEDFGEKADNAIRPVRVVKLDSVCEDDRSVPILIKCLTADKLILSATQSSDCVTVSSRLFKCIVGQDACLLSSPAIIVCPPGGSAYVAPVKMLDTHPSLRTFVTNAEDEATMTNCSGLKLLSETTSKVVTLNLLSVKTKLKGSEDKRISLTEMIVIVCENGLVHFLSVPQEDKGDLNHCLQTLTFSVDSPVVCACSFKDKLYHSTGRYLCETTVSLGVASAKEGKYVPHTEVRRFQLLGVEDLMPYKQDGVVDTEETPCVVHCCHTDGRVTKFYAGETFKEYKPYEGGNLAETMKEMLLAIDLVDKKREHIRQRLTKFEYMLKQINIATSLYRQYITELQQGQKVSNSGGRISNIDSGASFKCKCQARLPEGENYDHIWIDCEIGNQMVFSLSCDWSVMVTIRPSSSSEDCVSRSYKLYDEFVPSHRLTISIAVKPKLILHRFDVTVSFLLRISLDSDKSISLCVPIHNESVDALYFLQGDKADMGNMNRRSSNLLGEQLFQLAKTRPASSILLGSTPERSETSVCITASAFLKTGKKSSALKGPIEPRNILNYLLENSGLSQEISADSGSYRTLLGQPVYLSVAVNQSGGETTLLTVSVRSEVPTAAAVHQAVKHRLQLLTTETSAPGLQTENLKRKLYQLQDLENDVTRLQTDRNCQKDVKMLAAVYEKLRKITSLS